MAGGAFLVEKSAPESVFTVEDLSEEHLAIGRTAEEFFRKEVEPNLDALLHQEPGLATEPAAQIGRARPHGNFYP